ncbi:hypothetical protein AVEN_29441-1 [Araneus ventricosus]|uniref:Uncharacterized protein n=1 Tax=Araneus ventricosus TaxID=182803 RepID=A0A4Y2CYX5_ARAVE|nr:hypothetical protein AVEN_29441-1 [Araneus ventricosus]
MWKFGEGDASSGVVFVIWPQIKYFGPSQNSPRVASKRDFNITKRNRCCSYSFLRFHKSPCCTCCTANTCCLSNGYLVLSPGRNPPFVETNFGRKVDYIKKFTPTLISTGRKLFKRWGFAFLTKNY